MVDLVFHHLVVVGFPLGKAQGWSWNISGPSDEHGPSLGPQLRRINCRLSSSCALTLGLGFVSVSEWHVRWHVRWYVRVVAKDTVVFVLLFPSFRERRH